MGLFRSSRLGDSEITFGGNTSSYLRWQEKPPRRVARLDKRNGQQTFSLRFYTRAVFRIERELFYAESGKHVPATIEELLDPTALAVWFMDDGGRGGRTPRGMVWNVTSFKSNDRELLRLALANRYGIETTLQNAGNGIHLYVRSRSAPTLIDLIREEIISSMMYKLPLDPVTT